MNDWGWFTAPLKGLTKIFCFANFLLSIIGTTSLVTIAKYIKIPQ